MTVSPNSKFVPGTGTYGYNKEPILKTDPQWRFGTGNRDDKEKIMRRTSNFPPPNSYNPDF